MNSKLRILLGVGLVLFVFLGLFPPWIERVDIPSEHFEKFAGYGFIGSPPKSVLGQFGFNVNLGKRASMTIAVNQLCVQWVILVVVVGGLTLMFRPMTPILDVPPLRIVLAWRERPSNSSERVTPDSILVLFQMVIRKWAKYSTVLTFHEGGKAWEELSRRDPSLLVMRWDYGYSRQLLRYLGKRMVNYPIVVLKTHRPAELAEEIHALTPSLNITMLPITEGMMGSFETVWRDHVESSR